MKKLLLGALLVTMTGAFVQAEEVVVAEQTKTACECSPCNCNKGECASTKVACNSQEAAETKSCCTQESSCCK